MDYSKSTCRPVPKQLARSVLRDIQNSIGYMCSILEKLHAIVVWKDPFMSSVACAMVASVALLLIIVPARILFALAGMICLA